MLTRKLNSRKCHSLIPRRAQLRIASTFVTNSLHRSETCKTYIQSCPKAFNLPYGRTLTYKRPQTIIFQALRVAHLSTTTSLLIRPQSSEGKFLKPRRKPKFRQRTEEDSKKLLQASKETDVQYKHETLKDPGGGVDGSSVIATSFNFVQEARLPSSLNKDRHFPDSTKATTFRSHSDSYHGLQHGLPKIIRVPRSEASTADLEHELHFLSQKDPHPAAIYNILQILIYDRKIEPKSQYYEALICANTWPEYGSVGNVQKILSEMEAKGMEIDANIISAVLKVLAVHPSIELSYHMMSMVERRWLQLSSETHHHLILGVIRTGQIELAAWMLDVLRDKDKSSRSWDRDVVPDYLVVVLIVEMVKIGDWEGILRYMYKLRNRRAADRDIPVKFWGWVLERVAQAARHLTEPFPSAGSILSLTEPLSDIPIRCQSQYSTSYMLDQHALSLPASHLTQYIYTMYVSPMSHRPSYATLVDILHLAANTGIPWLAHSVAATMTYMDGIDDTGTPIATLSDEVTELVKQAENRAIENEPEDLKKNREIKTQLENEKIRIKDEDEKWWEHVFQVFSENGSNSNSNENGDATVDAKRTGLNQIDNTNSTQQTPVNNTVPLKPGSKPTLDKNKDTTTKPIPAAHTSKKFLAFNPDKIPPGNLWPVFPTIGSLGSAYIDPWEALGPRMAARRKWTEAQKEYKLMERAGRKRH